MNRDETAAPERTARAEADEDIAANMPAGARLARMALALGLGALGGLLFARAGMPLPWMLGAMVVNTVAALLSAPVLPPARIRPYVVVVIGVMLGAGFTPEIAGRAGDWLVSLGFLALYLAVAGLLVVPFYRRVGGFDTVTAFFAGMPGGLNEMMLIGKDMGGDERRIILAHASRILVTVCLLALWFRFVAGAELGDRSAFGVPFAELPPGELAVLAACGVAGYLLGAGLRLPAPALLGPMLVSAAAHLGGISESPPPSELVVLAQVILGTIIGCRFLGAAPRSILHAIALSLGATLLTLAVTLSFALAFAGLFRQTVEQVLLAYAPGGLAEMSLIALAMDADVAYVAVHHIARIALLVLLAPAVFALVARRRGGR